MLNIQFWVTVLLYFVVNSTTAYTIITKDIFVELIEEDLYYKDPSDWWQTASFYQIYPRSFHDSNGDGIGDLNGITERLDYLKGIGITATWLSPIFKSPMVDFGYDISDFYNIQPEYGTLEDFDNLIKRAKELGIKIILDFVPNHSSDENEWFKKSENKEPGFENFYVWHPGFVDTKNASNKLPPNNWISLFRGSAWHFNEKRQEFYLHQFAVKQPDLNYRNPAVVNEMKNVMKFWLQRGVSGFRVDACPHIFEVHSDSKGNFPDEPRSGSSDDKDDWNYLNHIYTKDRPETLDMIYQFREVLDDYKKEHNGDTRVMLTESYSSLDVVMKYYGDGVSRNGAHLPFNFQLIMLLSNNSNSKDYKNVIELWMNNMPAGRTPNWVMGNHDQNRVSARLGTDRIDMINMMLLTLPGASVTYYGEEIGMTDVWISWNDTKDPAACNTNPSVYEKFSRDPERTPFQWDKTVSAGFSTNTKTWLPVADNYDVINVDGEYNATNSHLLVYRSLMQLRKDQKTFAVGNLKVYTPNENVVVIIREHPGENTFITVANIGSSFEKINLETEIKTNKLVYSVVSVSSQHKKGDEVYTNHIVLLPKESFVLQSSEPKAQSKKEYYNYNTIN